jgi:NAD-dependent DNA ligase
MDIVGSYRRGAKNSGDIDIIITNADNNKAAFNQFLDTLIKDKVVIEVLSRGGNKSLTIGKLPGKQPRRLDFLYTSPSEYAFAILYFTGSKAFNTVMRNRALQKGYTLNEHGLSIMEKGKKGEKLDLKFTDERSIFEFLNMKFKEPRERKDGRAVEIIHEEEVVPIQTEIVIKESSPKNKTVKKKSVKKTIEDTIKEFQRDGIDVLKKMSKKELESLIKEASKSYYNENKFIMTDNEYDIVKEYIEKKYPKSEELKKIGAPVEKNKVKLPFNMPSMDKIKPDTNAIEKWEQKYPGPYVLSAKLDGISGLYSTQNGTPKLYTRGDGKVGQDISYMIPYLKLPTVEELKEGTIRGELIMPKKTFEDKYSSKFANARNLVSGIVGAKTIDSEKYGDVDFVAYEVMQPELKPSEQMKLLESLNVDVVINQNTDKVSNEILSKILVEWRSGYEYEIDGVIVTDDQIYPRTDGNPDHSFAFKMVLLDQIAEAKVLNVLWSPSKDGYLKPRIQIEPIQLGGVTIEYATAFNAAFVEENKLGIGALVKIIRSGDVIPYIQEVVEPATQIKMPSEDYVWNSTHVDIMLKNPEENEIVREKNILAFMTRLGVDGIGPGNIKKIVKAGFDSVPKILAMSLEDFKKVENFKEKMATKVYNSIHEKINNADIVDIMVASNIFGRGLGEKKMEPIIQAYPDILITDESHDEKVNKVLKVKGMATKSANLFVDNIKPFVDFMVEAGLQDKLSSGSKKTPVNKESPLFEKKVVMTGFRDKDILEFLKKQGADIMASVNKKTDIVIIKSEDDTTSKSEQAKELGIQILTRDTFVEKYMA